MARIRTNKKVKLGVKGGKGKETKMCKKGGTPKSLATNPPLGNYLGLNLHGVLKAVVVK